jgi:HK97 family phage major capsid protein
MTLKELRDKQKNILTLARQKLDEIKADTTEARAKEIEAEHDSAMVDYDRLGEQIARAQKLSDAEARAEKDTKDRRPIGEDDETRGDDGDKKPDVNKTFKRLIQFGMEGLNLEERKVAAQFSTSLTPEMRAQSTTGAAGGFTIPQGFSGEIDKAMLAWGPMYDPAITRVLTTDSGNLLPWPTMDDTAQVGALLAENSAISAQDITFGNVNMNAYVYTSKLVLVSMQLLMDSAFNMESEILNPAFGERLGRIANAQLTTGTGTSQPNGVMTASSLGTTTAAVAAVTADEIINFYHSVDPAYRASPNARMMFNDSTLLAVRKLKDAQNRYLIDGLKDSGATLNLAGISVPYSINQAVASMATGNRFMAFGDFSKYVVRKVKDYQLLVLRERYAEFLQTGFFAFARFDGNLINPSAIKHMKNA